MAGPVGVDPVVVIDTEEADSSVRCGTKEVVPPVETAGVQKPDPSAEMSDTVETSPAVSAADVDMSPVVRRAGRGAETHSAGAVSAARYASRADGGGRVVDYDADAPDRHPALSRVGAEDATPAPDLLRVPSCPALLRAPSSPVLLRTLGSLALLRASGSNAAPPGSGGRVAGSVSAPGQVAVSASCRPATGAGDEQVQSDLWPARTGREPEPGQRRRRRRWR